MGALVQLVVVLVAFFLPSLVKAQEGVGYPSVAAALEALKARTDVRISVQGGWTIVNEPRDGSVWSFTPPSHPAHPAVVKRSPEQKDGAMFIQMRALCQAEKAACDKLIEEFQELNRKIAADMQRRSQAPKSEWSPSDEQKSRAVATLQRFLAATDEGRHQDAYDMLTPGMKGMMSFDRFRYTNPALKRFFGGARNEQLELDLNKIDQVWVGDITYLKVGGIYRYLAVVMDKYSRRVLGWAYGKRKDVPLTLKALNRAVRSRKPNVRGQARSA